MKRMHRNSSYGFTLVEMLLYVALFVIASTFIVGILATVMRLKEREVGTVEVGEQLSFVTTLVKRLVGESSLIDMPVGVTTSTLTIRMSSSTLDATTLSVASGTIVMREGNGGSPVSLTDAKVFAESFLVTKYENAASGAVVRLDITLRQNTENPSLQFSRTFRGAFSRASAATFDSHLVPNANQTWDIGNASMSWRDLYARDAAFMGFMGIGTAPSASARLKVNGDIAVAGSGNGLVLPAPGGACFRITVTDAGSLATSTVGCP